MSEKAQLAKVCLRNSRGCSNWVRISIACNPIFASFIEVPAEDAAQRTGLSPRACQRILKVSRTIADLDGSERIGDAHLAEALAYRGVDPRKISAAMEPQHRCHRVNLHC